MRVRRLLVLTAFVSSLLGALAVYLALSVPNDLKAGAMLKAARARIAEGKPSEAHDTLSQIIQQFPRTDAAAAATVALVKLEEQERQRLQAEISRLRQEQAAQAKVLGDLQKSVETIRTAAPKAATVAAPPAKKTTTVKKSPTKKRPTTKRTTTKRRKR